MYLYTVVRMHIPARMHPIRPMRRGNSISAKRTTKYAIPLKYSDRDLWKYKQHFFRVEFRGNEVKFAQLLRVFPLRIKINVISGLFNLCAKLGSCKPTLLERENDISKLRSPAKISWNMLNVCNIYDPISYRFVTLVIRNTFRVIRNG